MGSSGSGAKGVRATPMGNAELEDDVDEDVAAHGRLLAVKLAMDAGEA